MIKPSSLRLLLLRYLIKEARKPIQGLRGKASLLIQCKGCRCGRKPRALPLLTDPHRTQGKSVMDPTVVKEQRSRSFKGVGNEPIRESYHPDV